MNFVIKLSWLTLSDPDWSWLTLIILFQLSSQLAEKRKQMLDEFSIDQQKVVTEHQDQLERLETSYKEEAKKSQEEFKVIF